MPEKNNLKNKLSFSSLQTKLLYMVLGVFLPILFFLIANNIYSSNLVRQQAHTLNLNTISLYMQELDGSLSNMERQLSRLSSLDSDFRILESSDSQVGIYYASQNISNALSELILTSEKADAVFVFATQSQILIDETETRDDYDQRESIREFLHGYLLSDDINLSEWFPVKINDNNYFFRILRDDSTYMGTWVNMTSLLDPFISPELTKLNYVLFADSQGTPLSDIPEYFSGKFVLETKGESIYISENNEKYIFIGHGSRKGDFSLMAFISEKEILSGLIVFRVLFIILFILILLLLAIIISLQRITIINPVNNLVAAMQSVQSGNWDVILEETQSSSEFRLLNQTYNSMIREIKKLKINIYEEQLMKQKAELQFFQLQIRPHFLINALNIIYNLAQVGKFSLIQKMSHYLIRHFQYTIKSNFSMVSIKDEFYYTKNYISIQKLRFPDVLESSFDIEKSIAECAVPPLSIQTFVENSIKYAMSIEEPVKLKVTAKTFPEDENKIIITVCDSGPGFTPEVLEALSKEEKISDKDGEHIGIYNVRHRLSLLFGDEAELKFSNCDKGGAKVEMILPKQTITNGV